MLGRKWRPRYSTKLLPPTTPLSEEKIVEELLMVVDEGAELSSKGAAKKKKKSKNRGLSTKSECLKAYVKCYSLFLMMCHSTR